MVMSRSYSYLDQGRRERWKTKLSGLRTMIVRSTKLRKAGAPVSLLEQLIFSLDVAVATLPDSEQVSKALRAGADILVGTVRAVGMGNPGQLLQG